MCYYLLGALGITYILKYGTILESARRVLGAKFPALSELFHCSLCLGFWAGVLLVPSIYGDDDISSRVYGTHSVTIALLFPFASAAWCWTIDELHDAVVVWKNRD